MLRRIRPSVILAADAENMAAVIGKDGVETEIQVGQMC